MAAGCEAKKFFHKLKSNIIDREKIFKPFDKIPVVKIFKIKTGIIGLDNLFVGLLFSGIWFALFWFGKHWIFNTIGFFCLIFGAFGFFQGIQQIIYSASKIPRAKKGEQSKEKTRTDILLFLTKLFGVVLVIVQIIKAVMDLSI